MNKGKKKVVIKLKILNKKWEGKKKENQFTETLDLFLWHQILILSLLTGAFLVSLSLLNVVMLGCVSMHAAPL
jgi:hypothetical protein